MHSNTEVTGQHITILPSSSWQVIDLREIWRYRELLYFLAWRDIKVRYKQTILGATWALLQPLLTMALFNIIFGLLLHVETSGAPYPIFVFAALLPWQLFAFALTNASESLINDKNLVSKVYFPRTIVPLSSVVAGLADFAVSFVILIIMLFFFRISISYRILILPLFILLALASALAVGIWLSALIVKYRDFRYIIPFLTQFWMYATPIAYASSLIPAQWQAVYALNPMVGVVEGFRWALLGNVNLDFASLLISTSVVIVLFVGGLIYFRSMEDYFADVI
jgi:ABC-type polysaccharide/polyol phosphate export systems, permease component